MSETTSHIRQNITDIYKTVLADTSGEVFAINLGERASEQLVHVLSEMSEPPAVRLLARDSVLKWLRDDFLIASTAADLIDAGTLSLRVDHASIKNPLLVTEETVVSIVALDDRVAGLVADDTAFVGEAREQRMDEWNRAEDFSLRTPARSRVYSSLDEQIGSEVAMDFRAVLDSLDTTRGEERLDEVMVSLLVAAKHRVQLYEISKWGEDEGIASKATFSRVKTRLEEMGVIETEKVPIDVGRPRLRLVLGDERLHGADADELANTAQSVLSQSTLDS